MRKFSILAALAVSLAGAPSGSRSGSSRFNARTSGAAGEGAVDPG